MYYDKMQQINFIKSRIRILELQLTSADLDRKNKQFANEQIDMYESILIELSKTKSDK